MGSGRAPVWVFIVLVALLFSCELRRKHHSSVFYYNEPTGIASLDPAFAKNQSIIWAVNQIYNGLVSVDAEMRTVPCLAKSWEISPDRKTYRFHLRTDAYFHDDPVFPGGKGRKFNARDVAFSFQRLIDPATASPGAWVFNSRVDKQAPFTVVDDSTFDLRLARPFSPILGVLSSKYCSVVPREAVTYYGKDFRRHPCGTGPFQLATWDEGQALVLRKHPRYFEKDQNGRQLPYLEAVQISFHESKATEFLLFRQGRIDFMNDIDPSFKDEVLNKRGELKKQWVGKIQLQKHPYLNTEYLGILTDTLSPLLASSPLKHLAVRRAINLGFDRRKLMFYLRNSIGSPAESGFVPQGLPSFDSSLVKGYRYDPVRARALLRSAGFAGGEEMPSLRLLTIPIYADLAGFIARQLEEIGLHVVVEAIPKSLLLEQTAQSRALFFRASWIADYPDAENFLSVFYSKNPAPPNYTRFANREYDALYEQAIQTTDDSLRKDIYRQMDRILIREAPVVPLWYDEVIRLVQPGVSGFLPNSFNLLELKTVQKNDSLH